MERLLCLFPHRAPAEVVGEVEERVGGDEEHGLVGVGEAARGGGHGYVQQDVDPRHDVGVDADLVQRLVCGGGKHWVTFVHYSRGKVWLCLQLMSTK